MCQNTLKTTSDRLLIISFVDGFGNRTVGNKTADLGQGDDLRGAPEPRRHGDLHAPGVHHPVRTPNLLDRPGAGVRHGRLVDRTAGPRLPHRARAIIRRCMSPLCRLLLAGRQPVRGARPRLGVHHDAVLHRAGLLSRLVHPEQVGVRQHRAHHGRTLAIGQRLRGGAIHGRGVEPGADSGLGDCLQLRSNNNENDNRRPHNRTDASRAGVHAADCALVWRRAQCMVPQASPEESLELAAVVPTQHLPDVAKEDDLEREVNVGFNQPHHLPGNAI